MWPCVYPTSFALSIVSRPGGCVSCLSELDGKKTTEIADSWPAGKIYRKNPQRDARPIWIRIGVQSENVDENELDSRAAYCSESPQDGAGNGRVKGVPNGSSCDAHPHEN
mmetsp:Transcript_6156/g.18600  ORF Transcript_6156/g.18600 Transcript_6156/m.18600 type:complete len:110 (-) Transcript_6156:606-935(-)